MIFRTLFFKKGPDSSHDRKAKQAGSTELHYVLANVPFRYPTLFSQKGS
jgi:hypothetical protein